MNRQHELTTAPDSVFFNTAENRQSRTEWKAWQMICVELVNLTREDVNSEKYKSLFRAIDNWGCELAKLRVLQKESGKFDCMASDGRLFSTER